MLGDLRTLQPPTQTQNQNYQATNTTQNPNNAYAAATDAQQQQQNSNGQNIHNNNNNNNNNVKKYADGGMLKDVSGNGVSGVQGGEIAGQGWVKIGEGVWKNSQSGELHVCMYVYVCVYMYVCMYV